MRNAAKSPTITLSMTKNKAGECRLDGGETVLAVGMAVGCLGRAQGYREIWLMTEKGSC
jgi:hypothetical protein